MRALVTVALIGAFSLGGHLPAQETPSDTLLTVGHFLDMEQVGSPQLSPDGSQIIYTRSHVNKLEDRWDSELWIMSADGSRNH